MGISLSRCFNHAAREAVARCPECTDYFCRECVTEHENKVICASCFRTTTEGAEQEKRNSVIVSLLALVLGVALIWCVTYLVGRGLLAVPSSWHME